MRTKIAVATLIGIALLALVWHETGTVRETTSATYDEMTYADMAFAVRAGDFAPPVTQGVAPLPVLLDALAIGPFRPGDLNSPALLQLIDRVRRVHVATTALPMIAVVYLWLLWRRRWAVASCAALCLALSPTFLAHISLATTDAMVALWSVVTLAALVWHEQKPMPWRLSLVVLALGMALGAKYSAVCLLPAVVISLGWRRAAIAATGAGLVVWALSGFLVMPLVHPQDYVGWLGHGPVAEHALSLAQRISLPAPLVGVARQALHQHAGHDAFLFGHLNARGWWYYFPVAIALKSTPAELAVVLLLPLLVFAAWSRRDHAFTLWVTTLVSFAAMLFAGRVDVGIRYALPLYPLVALCAADALALVPVRRLVAIAAGVLLVASQAFSSASVAPHYLSYFNVAAGGPAGGYRYLGDSNIDWGQDLPALATEINSLGRPRVCMAYFGSAPVTAYGIDGANWSDPLACRNAEWLALSVTYLQGLYIKDDPFRELRAEAPDRRAGFSIFLYRTQRPVVAAAIEKAWAAPAYGVVFSSAPR